MKNPHNSSILAYETVAPGKPLTLVCNVSRDEGEDAGCPGWHDLLVLTLREEDAARLLHAYRFARRSLAETIAPKFLYPRKGQAVVPVIEFAVTVPVALHSSASAAGTGWEMDYCDHWIAAPKAFPRKVLGPANQGFASYAYFRPALQVFQNGAANLRVYADESDDDLPRYFSTEPLPIEEMQYWQKEQTWKGEFIPHQRRLDADD